MLILSIALALLFADEPLQPRTYLSPSGAWSLSVDPSSSDGSGSTRLVAKKLGQVQWTDDGDLCLRQAVIDDEGRVAAVLDGPSDSVPCRLLLDEAGQQRSSDALWKPRDSFRRTPEVSLLLQAENDLAIFRVSDPDQLSGDERWFAYRMSTGEELEDVHPAKALAQPADHPRSLDCATVRGTPLVLVQWLLHSTSEEKRMHWGSEFVLYDETWKVVWSRALPSGFDRELSGEDWKTVEESLDTACILDAGADLRFEVREDLERVMFEVNREGSAGSGWRVREIARSPFITGTDLWPTRQLDAAAAIVLEADPNVEPGPIRDIVAFRFDDEDRIEFVRREESGCTLVRLDEDGAVAREVRVGPIAVDDDSSETWIPAAQADWFCSVNGRRWGSNSSLWRVDGDSGAAERLTELPRQAFDPSIAPLQDGGFVLFLRSFASSRPDVLEGRGADGSLIWRHEFTHDWSPSSRVDRVLDIAIAAGRAPLVLGIGPKVLRVDALGKLSEELDMTALDSAANYFDKFVPASDGSVWLHSRSDSDRWHHIAADGKELRSFVPRKESGSTRIGGLRCVCDSEGRLWTNDGNQIFQYDELGVAHPKLGRAPESKRLANPGLAFLDHAGRIVIEDFETSALHVFDAAGKRTAICVPDPTDFDSGYGIEAVFKGSDGGLVAVESDGGRYVTFAADGKRTGSGAFGGEEVAFDGRTGERWVVEIGTRGLLQLRRFDATGNLVLDVEQRRPDGGFFEAVVGFDVAPDGSAVVLDSTGSLCFYARDGKPQREIAFGVGEFWSTGGLYVGRRWIVTGNLDGGALLVSLPDGACSRVVPDGPEMADRWWTYGISPDEKELWALQLSPPTLHRFTLPR